MSAVCLSCPFFRRNLVPRLPLLGRGSSAGKVDPTKSKRRIDQSDAREDIGQASYLPAICFFFFFFSFFLLSGAFESVKRTRGNAFLYRRLRK